MNTPAINIPDTVHRIYANYLKRTGIEATRLYISRDYLDALKCEGKIILIKEFGVDAPIMMRYLNMTVYEVVGNNHIFVC